VKTVENLLIPGRHHLITNFQEEYLRTLIPGGQFTDVRGQQLELQTDPNIIWAVTSANHGNTKRNPFSGNRREQAIEALASQMVAKCFSFPINDLGYTPRFADFVIKDIEVQSDGHFNLNPGNTAVICSTPAVIELYEELGYKILPAELARLDPEEYDNIRPWDCMMDIVEAGNKWRTDSKYLQNVHPVSRQIIEKYHLGDRVVELYNDPLLGDEGDITDTRDYETYRKAFEDGARRKYNIIRSYIKNGRIVDIGCATGEIVKLIAEDPTLIEADIYGIEASQALYRICEQRRQDGHFKNENTFFYQRNFMNDVIFAENSVNTTTTFSLTHEIESYLGRQVLEEFLQRIYNQTTTEGVFINVDVVGPEHKDEIIVMELNDQDGITESNEEIKSRTNLSAEELQELSTLGRFKRFAKDFRAAEDKRIEFQHAAEHGNNYVQLRLADACEFLSKKDYTDNWYSEMHETFCYWNFEDWKAAASKVGFTINKASHAYRNDWIVENRYKNKVALFTNNGGNLEPIDFPETNMLLIAEKRA
jgi:SAM-dependent methyltransferase